MNPLLSYARAYCRLNGITATDEELEREITTRSSWLPWHARAAAWAGALAVRWVMPLVLLRKISLFDGLTPADADKLLKRLQNSHFIFKAPFLTVKLIVLPACYARAEHLKRIGYGTNS
jgi:hypothetical protein